ncbi:MAG: response regulator, partial [candidate division Zixibacteria bacterium]|nr:response regulator [candidate division Zixibacteria bacterium]
KDGTTFPAEMQGRLLDFRGQRISVTSLRNISIRKTAENALMESERKNEALLNSVPDLIFVLSREGVFLDYRASSDTALYVPPSEFLNRSAREVLPADVADATLFAIKQALASNEVCKIEFTLALDGRNRDQEARAVAVGRDRVLFIVRDITENKRLRELESRAQRLETAGRIAGQVAHDFNNLLGPLMAYPELIRESLPQDHGSLPFLSSIEEATRQIADINQQLLALGRRGHYSQSPLNLNDIVRQVVGEIEAVSPSVVCETVLAEDLMNVKGGYAQIHRVLLNLVHNARDAMDGKGVITITSENFYVDKPTSNYWSIPMGEYAKLSIKDTGCGIPDEIVGHVFEPFFTSKTVDKKRGSGLGLSVVDGVVKDHAGYVDLRTKVGQGTTFYLYFPITREELRVVAVDEFVGGSERILVVDDDPMQREVSLTLLRRLGYNASAALGGEDAIRILRDAPQDLLILDMVMPPGIDGAETLRRVLIDNPGQKAIVVSGFSETDRVVEAKRLGAGGFVRKPLSLGALARAVRKELDRQPDTVG